MGALEKVFEVLTLILTFKVSYPSKYKRGSARKVFIYYSTGTGSRTWITRGDTSRPSKRSESDAYRTIARALKAPAGLRVAVRFPIAHPFSKSLKAPGRNLLVKPWS